MKKYLKLILIAFIVVILPLVLSNCIEEENDLISQRCESECTIVKGRLTTDNGSLGLANVRLVLKWVNTKYLAGGVIRAKATAKTSGNGEFELKFTVRDDELEDGYFVVDYLVNPDKYLIYGENNFFVGSLKRDTSVTINFLIPPKAYIKGRIRNTDQMAPDDYFATTFSSNMGNGGNCCSGVVVMWKNPPLNPVEVAGNQPLYVETSKTTEGTKTVRIDTLFIPAGATHTFTADFNE